MKDFLNTLNDINSAINDFVWVKIGIILLIGAGILTTCATKFFQISHIGHWWKNTIGGVFKKESKATRKTDKQSISQFQALCTALAATIGTGNIAGVSGAIVMGGAGAVFWMWVAAFFGMMTNFSENILGIYYRRKNSKGEWCGGAMYYLKDGLGSKKHCKTLGSVLAVLFSIFAILASFGIGNMGQINKITLNLKSTFFKNSTATIGDTDISIPALIIGIALMILAGLIIIGGLQRIAAFAERVIPFMAVAYILGSIAIVIYHISDVGKMFGVIFKCAFDFKAVGGAAGGLLIKQAVVQGCKRGVFSNEAGLGSSVMVHSSSNVKEPVIQGMWGIFEVFFDTIVVCTMTALVVLSSGAINLDTGLAAEGTDDATLVATSFSNVFGKPGEIFVSLAILLFAFTTVLGWSQYGTRAWEYLFGEKSSKYYRIFFVLLIVSGSVMTSSIAWDISDTFNGLMMIPNLIGVITLLPMIIKLTKNYVNRNIKGIDEEPILSYHPEIQEDHKSTLND
ncbi:MAG: alanine:cation symporter family protein [Lachnospiraceae bacterium]|nr:alanine:cation symporter family protein [Lachnospiraceae bacterium]